MKQVQKLMDSLPTINKKWIRPCELGDLIVLVIVKSLDIENKEYLKDSYRYVGNRYEYPYEEKALADFENRVETWQTNLFKVL